MTHDAQCSTKWVFSVSETMSKPSSTRLPCPAPQEAQGTARQQQEASFLVSCGDETSQGQREGQVPRVESLAMQTFESAQGLALNSNSEFGSIWLEASVWWPRGKGCEKLFLWAAAATDLAGLFWGSNSRLWGPSQQLRLGSLLSLRALHLWSLKATRRLGWKNLD